MAGNNAKTKQVIIMRKDLGLSIGKTSAQAAHASLSAILESSHIENDILSLNLDETCKEWFTERFTKIVLYVNSEEELVNYYNKAKSLNLRVSRLIKDAGFTELKEPTVTCFAIGPNLKEDIDQLTKKLKIYNESSKERSMRRYLQKRTKELENTNNLEELNYLKDILGK